MDPSHVREDWRTCFTEEERQAIRQQLERMLANPLFKYSKRYPNLLRFVVESTLDGRTEELKERSLGVAVFGREPDYDTNLDPVVRTTAGEIRKRIAQYSHEHGHEAEVRIELSPRSYIPEFEMPAPVQPTSAPVLEPAPKTASLAHRWRWLAIGAAAGLLALAVVWATLWGRWADLDRFWKPVLDSSNTVLLCMGQREFL